MTIEQLDPKLAEDDRFKLKESINYYNGEYKVKQVGYLD